MIENSPACRRDFFEVDRIAALAAQGLLVGLVLFAADALGHLRLQPGEFAAVWTTCVALRCGMEAYSIRRPGRGVLSGLLEYSLLAAFWLGINRYAPHAQSFAQIVFVSGIVGLAEWAWRAWKIPEGFGAAGEQTRRLLIVFATGWAIFPLFADRLGGGVDARWYATMLADFIEQTRAGKLLVFVGQGPHAFNGGVHPFRSAPLYMWVAGIWDLVTLRTLNVFALQHLSAITAALAGALGLYIGLLKIVPGRRWAAALAAASYILSPGVLAPLYCADMYMTFMTLAALPLVFCGNARFLMQRDKAAGRLLAIGLVLTWMAHPPTALEATLATLVLQLTGWICSRESVVGLAHRGLYAALWFVALGAYYFSSMSEVPPQPGAPVRPDLVMVVGLSLGWIAAGRGLLWRQWAWTLLAVPAALIALKLNPAWIYWLGALCLFAFVAGWWIQRLTEKQRLCWSPTILVGCGMLAAAVAWQCAVSRGLEAEESTLGGLHLYNSHWERFFLPLSPEVNTYWDFQLGYAVVFLLFIAIVVSAGRSRVVAAFSGVSLLIVLMMIRIPGVSDFFVGYPLLGMAQITSLPLPHRVFPPAAALIAVCGFLALASLPRGARAVTLSCLALLLVWTGWQDWHFVWRGINTTLPRAKSEAEFRSENAVMDRFAYDLLPIPDYFSHGKMDPRLETRLLGNDLQIRVGPDAIARLMEKNGSEELVLHTGSQKGSADWVRMNPGFTVNPGKTVLLRFSFNPKNQYDGYLIATSPFGGYREYLMPSSGLPAAFGVEPQESKVLSFWNTHDLPANYIFTHYLRPGSNLAPDGRVYATVVKSHYKPEDSPIQMESWIPYRVRVRVAEPGFVETPRVFIPGYVAKIDGRPAPIQKSQQRLVMVPTSAGEHVVELDYIGTPRLWFAFVMSAIALFSWFRAHSRESRANAAVSKHEGGVEFD